MYVCVCILSIIADDENEKNVISGEHETVDDIAAFVKYSDLHRKPARK